SYTLFPYTTLFRSEVRVARWVRGTELEPHRVLAREVDRDADAGRAVALRIDQVDRRLVARHEAAVAVRRRSGEGEDRRRVLEQPPDVPLRHLGQVGVATLLEEQVLAVFPQALVRVHSRAVVS